MSVDILIRIAYNKSVIQNNLILKEIDIMSKVNVFKQVLSDSSDLTRAVVRRIVDGDLNKLTDEFVDDVINEMNEVVKYGCSSGCCSPFIYTNDNTDFLRENLEEVFELLDDLEYAHYSVDKVYDVDAMVWTSVEYCLSDFVDNYNYLIEYDEE